MPLGEINIFSYYQKCRTLISIYNIVNCDMSACVSTLLMISSCSELPRVVTRINLYWALEHISRTWLKLLLSIPKKTISFPDDDIYNLSGKIYVW